jgi:hypothetical protein
MSPLGKVFPIFLAAILAGSKNMNKKLLDIFVDPKILLKEAIEKDLKEIEKLRKRSVVEYWHLDRKELKCVRKIKDELILLGKNLDIVETIKAQTYRHYCFHIQTSIDIDDLRELLRVFARNTTEALINQKTQVECQIGDSNLIVECPE